MKLVRAQVQDAERIWKMQIEAFSELYAKYEDTETSPAVEPLEKVIMRLEQPYTYYYFIEVDGTVVGAIRVVDRKESSIAKRISPIFIMTEYRAYLCAESDTIGRRDSRGIKLGIGYYFAREGQLLLIRENGVS